MIIDGIVEVRLTQVESETLMELSKVVEHLSTQMEDKGLSMVYTDNYHFSIDDIKELVREIRSLTNIREAYQKRG